MQKLNMISEKAISEIVNDLIGEGDLFLVKLRVTTQNRIMVYIDGDNGVTIDDCSRLSRHIESHLDRDKEDFELEVSSVGLSQPLQLHRQYFNNIGRRLAVKLEEGKEMKGRLSEVSQEGILLEQDIKTKKKKKQKEPETSPEAKIFIPFGDIVEAKVLVSFK